MFKKILRQIIYGHRSSSESYEKFLKKHGANIGKNFTLYSPQISTIDVQSGFLLKIGDNFKATGPLTIMLHDYSWSVIHNKYGDIVGNRQPVKIGNNVFCGRGTTILCGVTIGDNVIIGANSLVTKDCESDSVYAGNPARKIMSLNEYWNKRKSLQYNELMIFTKEYFLKYKKFPPEDFYDEYFLCFEDLKGANEKFKDRLNLDNCLEISNQYIQNNENDCIFNDYDEFKKHFFETINMNKNDC